MEIQKPETGEDLAKATQSVDLSSYHRSFFPDPQILPIPALVQIPQTLFVLCLSPPLVRPPPSTWLWPRNLLVTKARNSVDVLLLDHEGCQIGRVASEKDDSEEGPHQDHDLAGGTTGVLDGNRVVEDQCPQQPHGLANGEGWST